MWSNGVGQNRETDEEHDDYCVKEEFQLPRVKFDRDGEGDREASYGEYEMDQNWISLIQEKQFLF